MHSFSLYHLKALKIFLFTPLKNPVEYDKIEWCDQITSPHRAAKFASERSERCEILLLNKEIIHHVNDV